MDLSPLFQLVAAHRWPIVAAFVVWMTVRALKDDIAATPTIPARWRPILSVALGAAAGVLEKLIGGADAGTATFHALLAGVLPIVANEVVAEGLLGGRTKASSGAVPPSAGGLPSGSSAGGAKADASAGAALHRGRCGVASVYRVASPRERERLVTAQPSRVMRLAWIACIVNLVGGPVACASTATLIAVAQVVAIAAPFAAQVVGDVESFLAQYWAQHPDPAKQAAVQAALDRAKAAAAALGQLASAGVDVSSSQYMAALDAFEQAYSDLLAAMQGLPGVVVQPTAAPGAPVTAKVISPSLMVLVVPPPSAFHPAVAK